MIIDETHKHFKTYYSRCRAKKEFESAELPISPPEFAVITVKDGHILGISCAFKTGQVGEKTWWNPMWAYMRYNSKLAIDTSRKAFKKLPKNCTLLASIMTGTQENANIYRAALMQAKQLGFKVVDHNKTTSVLKLTL